ncbi:MAG: hypothetical protein QOG83_3142 [Alphaproteobacteria bacterium]|jgi:hypothetical protein|nr:hypothetical protein [Alphaproteobacteria bacterium]
MRIEDVNIAHAVINRHAPIFHELIELLSDCLQQIGIRVSHTVNQLYPDRPNVIVGHTMFLAPQIFAGIRQSAPSYIVFQMEALHSEHGFSAKYPHYFEFLRGARQIWDYSPHNTRYLAGLGLANVHYIPIGYSPRHERITDSGEHDFDVLFYGVVSPRRKHMAEELERRGFKAGVLFGAYGKDRDAHIGRSKIQLNVHQFETLQLEQLRLAYLLNNKRFIISETSVDNPYGEGVVFCDYKDIVACCEAYLDPGMDFERRRIAELGYENLKRIPMTASIQSALAALTPD